MLQGKEELLKIIIRFLFTMFLFYAPVFALEPVGNLGVDIDAIDMSGIGDIQIDIPLDIPSIPTATTCPAGKIWNFRAGEWKCEECPEGTYNETQNLWSELIVNGTVGTWTTCPSCSGLNHQVDQAIHLANVTHTCTGSADCHDKKTDCYASVTFHGKGGKISSGQENVTVKAYYSPWNKNNYAINNKSCLLENNKRIALCKRFYKDNAESFGKYKITDGVTVETQWSKDNYQFAGWYINADLSGERLYDYTENGGLTNAIFSGDIDLYAKWVCNPGFYWNGTQCETCEANYFCKDGVKTECKSPNIYGGTYRHSGRGAKDETDCYSYLYLVTDDPEHPIETKVLASNITTTGLSCEVSGYKTCRVLDTSYYLIDSFANEAKIYNNSGAVVLDYSKSDNPTLVFIGWYKDPGFAPDNKVEAGDSPLSGDIILYRKMGCKKGYYGNSTAGCTKCAPGYTTLGPDKQNENDCVPAFQYGNDKFWAWPDAVDSVKFYEENIK